MPRERIGECPDCKRPIFQNPPTSPYGQLEPGDVLCQKCALARLRADVDAKLKAKRS